MLSVLGRGTRTEGDTGLIVIYPRRPYKARGRRTLITSLPTYSIKCIMAPNVIPSPFGPLPPLPETNFIYTILHSPSPPRPPLPDDYVTHIDGITGEQRTLKQLIARINELGAAFLAPRDQGGLAIRPKGQVVGLLSSNTIDYPTVVFALLQTAIPVALLNSHSTAPELAHQLKLARVTHVIVGPSSIPILKRALQIAGLRNVGMTIMEGCGKRARAGELTLQGLIDRTKKLGVQPAGIADVKRHTLAYLVFSSGTTQPREQPRYSEYPMDLAFLPMYHTMGLHVYNFSTLIVLPSWDADKVLECITKYRVTNIAMVPSLVFQLLAHPKLRSKEVDLSSLTGIGTGAAYLPPETEREFLNVLSAKGNKGTKLQRLHSGYGLSESTIAVASMPVEGMLGGKLGPKEGSAGVLLPGCSGRLCREAPPGTPMEELEDVAPGEPGELYVQGPLTALGYWDNEQATKEAFLPGGWLRTGDRFVYKDGHLWFQDRAKAVLKDHPEGYLLDACVAGVPGPRNDGELVPRAWVVLAPAGHKAGSKKVIVDLNEWVQGQLSKPKQLRGGIEIVKEVRRFDSQVACDKGKAIVYHIFACTIRTGTLAVV
ncbi:AMP dependent CoA ligase [Rhizoctonia solani AG-1 IA]|uniref:AMP dependent CoA ligase n=1 Tax=Thanatephorus cucumeris (strain AG1-IA) TaxID=983506 RepID=L8WQH1_THACA|nr:AMP dependent CoA ligase [Rhizoctonia solani AG-1 IA]